MGNSTGWSPKTKTLVAVGVAAGVAATGVASAAVIGAAASTAAGTAATTAGTTAATSGGANVEVGSKAVGSTTASFGKKLFGGVRKKRDSNDEVEKDANASITEASIADSFYNVVKDLVAAEDNKSASVLSTTVKSTSGK
ncbi:hypothetical protein LSAT2_010474 [Lamellibrachia satsuma]|nr:hypothetical protein LSAT2_010474 [Lamellibrachia satsuma]